MIAPDDWRRMGQEGHLLDRPVRRADWTLVPPDWDHDHCSFCWLKVLKGDDFYVTADDGHWWICPECFEDFKVEFRWTVQP